MSQHNCDHGVHQEVAYANYFDLGEHASCHTAVVVAKRQAKRVHHTNDKCTEGNNIEKQWVKCREPVVSRTARTAEVSI